MSTKFLQPRLWETIRKISKRAKHRTVAVAYLGTGASTILPLRKGDALIVDMTLGTVRGGQTNPYEVQKYFDKGVNVYSCPNLHAKTFLFDRTAIVGSTNVSKRSEKGLIEAALVTSEKMQVSRIRGFLKSLMFLQVDKKWITTCKRAYRPPKFTSSYHDTTNPMSRLWVAATWPIEFKGREKVMVDREEKQARKKIKEKKKYEPNTIRFLTGKSGIAQLIKPDDMIIDIWHEGKKTIQVYPPARVLTVKRYKKFNNGGPRTYVFYEESINPVIMKWHYFKSKVDKLPTREITENTTREVSPPVSQDILGLWS
jgi:hypothetical protein